MKSKFRYPYISRDDVLCIGMPCVLGCLAECFEMPRVEIPCLSRCLEIKVPQKSGWNDMLIMNMMHVYVYV